MLDETENEETEKETGVEIFVVMEDGEIVPAGTSEDPEIM